MKVSFARHFGLLGLLTLFLLLVIQPATAQVTPLMYLYVNWTPDEQLTSYDDDGSSVIEADEERYVSAQIYIDGNVQFWAVDIMCRMGSGNELELVDITFPDGTWAANGGSFVYTPAIDDSEFPEPTPAIDTIVERYNQVPGGGTLAFTITRVGANTSSIPFGGNGVNYTLPIATVRFKVKNLVRDLPVITACTSIRFLDRNGRLAMMGRQGTFTHLFVRIGYNLRGTVYRQGSVSHANIRVTCEHLATGDTEEAFTLVNGAFSFGGAVFTTQTANHLRNYGLYRCMYQSDMNRNSTVDDSDDQFLESVSYINLTTPKYQLMPVTIHSGDFDGNNTIALGDFNAITGSYGQVTTLPFNDGDANGDRLINQSDLALVAGNVDLSADETNPLSAEHTLYSLGTDYNTLYPFPNSRVQMGTPNSGAIERRNRFSATRDFWATLSPDGSEYAYISQNRITRVHSLFIGNMLNGVGIPFRLPVGFQYPEALAPSWSPDGGMLAWICSYNRIGDGGEAQAGYQLNQGALCYANRGDLLANTVTVLDDGNLGNNEVLVDSIFPPAWWSYQHNGDAFYAIVYSDVGQLRYYDLRTNSYGVMGDLPTSGADMPVIVNHWTGDSYLFYRHLSGEEYELRVTLLRKGATFSVEEFGLVFGGSLPNTFGIAGTSTLGEEYDFHMVIDNTTGADPDPDPQNDTPYGVQYYDVSPYLDIMLYLDMEGFNTTNMYFDAAPTATPDLSTHFWDNLNPSQSHYVDGNVGNPTQGSLGFGEWTGNMNDPTFLHAHRVTFDWVP